MNSQESAADWTALPDAPNRSTGAWLLAATFVLGAVVGGAGALLAARHFLLNPPPGGWAGKRIVAAMTRELKLDAVQQEKVRAILKETRSEIVGIADRVEPEVRTLLTRSRDRIRAELRADQQERFDREVAKRLEKIERLRKLLHEAG